MPAASGTDMSSTRRESAKRIVMRSWDRLRRPGRERRAVVLCYHSIHPDRSFASATPRAFDEHLAWLTDNFRVLPLTHDDLEAARNRAASDAPVVMLTFDDGYEDNYAYAFPALVRRGVRATFFVTTGLVEADGDTMARFVRERGCAPEDLRAMTWAQMR